MPGTTTRKPRGILMAAAGRRSRSCSTQAPSAASQCTSRWRPTRLTSASAARIDTKARPAVCPTAASSASSSDSPNSPPPSRLAQRQHQHPGQAEHRERRDPEQRDRSTAREKPGQPGGPGDDEEASATYARREQQPGRTVGQEDTSGSRDGDQPQGRDEPATGWRPAAQRVLNAVDEGSPTRGRSRRSWCEPRSSARGRGHPAGQSKAGRRRTGSDVMRLCRRKSTSMRKKEVDIVTYAGPARRIRE